MNRLRLLFCCGFAFCVTAISAQTTDDDYVAIYNLIQQADQDQAQGQSDAALKEYRSALDQLKKLRAARPDWNPAIVQYRLHYLEQKIGKEPATPQVPLPKLAPESPATNVPAPANPPALGAPAPSPPPAAPGGSPASAKDQQLNELMNAVRQLRNQNAVLENKLKEAWAAQPANLDPREFAKAQERINYLEKENALLNVALDQAQTRQTNWVEASQFAAAKNQLAAAASKAAEDAASLEALRQERDLLQNRLKKLEGDAARTSELGRENARLTRELADARKAAKAARRAASKRGSRAKLEAALTSRDAQIVSLQADLASLRKENTSLLTRLASAPSSGNAAAASSSAIPSDLADRLNKLQSERDELARKLSDAMAQLVAVKAPAGAASPEWKDLTNQLATLRARLDVYEAKKVPYSPEELALFKEPDLVPQKPAETTARPSGQIPVGGAALWSEGRRAFGQKRFDDAEKNFQQVLKLDPNNTYILQALAAAQFNLQELPEAEATLKKALAIDPSDAACLSLWGIVKIDEKKYDEAFDALSRAAQLNPDDAETQNYLGITLNEKGMREAAENALRRAVQLSPNYAGAHLNLAVIYATEKPPFLELARWHYQKALAGGQARNPDLEKLLGSR